MIKFIILIRKTVNLLLTKNTLFIMFVFVDVEYFTKK